MATKRRYEVLLAIASYWETNCLAPSLRDLMAATGIRSTSGVNYHVKALVEDGLLTQYVAPGAHHSCRNIALTPAGRDLLIAAGT